MLLEADNISLEVQEFGAMITDGSFRLPSGLIAKPFFANPWREDPEMSNVDPLIRNLGAEWPCVPFGMTEVPDDLPSDWQFELDPDWNEFVHGFGSCREWDLRRAAVGALAASIEYPEPAPVKKLERSISLDSTALSVNLKLKMEMRSAARVAIGLHPVFDLVGCSPQSCRIAAAGSSEAWSFPVDVEPGRSRFLPDQRPAGRAAGFDSGPGRHGDGRKPRPARQRNGRLAAAGGARRRSRAFRAGARL